MRGREFFAWLMLALIVPLAAWAQLQPSPAVRPQSALEAEVEKAKCAATDAEAKYYRLEGLKERSDRQAVEENLGKAQREVEELQHRLEDSRQAAQRQVELLQHQVDELQKKQEPVGDPPT